MLNKNTLKGEIFEYICCQVSFPAKVSFFKYRNHTIYHYACIIFFDTNKYQNIFVLICYMKIFISIVKNCSFE